jgi:hypothetical protein
MPPLPDLPRLSPVRQSAMRRWNALASCHIQTAFFLRHHDHWHDLPWIASTTASGAFVSSHRRDADCSEVGVGRSVKIYLPHYREKIARGCTAGTKVGRASDLIMAVEDDDRVRSGRSAQGAWLNRDRAGPGRKPSGCRKLGSQVHVLLADGQRSIEFQCHKLDRRPTAILVNNLHSFTWEILAPRPAGRPGFSLLARQRG